VAHINPSKILLVGIAAAAAAVTACGGSSPASSSTPAAATAGGGRGNSVAGQLAQLSGSKLVLSGQNGATDVTFDSSTRVQQTATGTLADIVAGTCITAAGQKDASGSLTATNVQLSPKANGTCAPAARNGASPNPGRSPGGGVRGNGATPPANFAFVRGEVASVSGTAVTVTLTAGGTQTLTVPPPARIVSTQRSSTAKLAVGQCILAMGQKDASGTVKARSLNIQPPGPTGCTFGGRGGGFGGGGG
jgi:Domain of unknown function (DUF5666)